MSEAVSTPHFATPPFATLVATLGDVSQPVAARMRSIFYLRTLGGPDAIGALCAALRDVSGTVLFRHEIAYVLGQMQAAESLPTLLAVLRDTADEPIVRHEAAEALGAIADPSTLPDLDEFTNDARSEVAETCAIASRRVRWVLERDAVGDTEAGLRDRNNPYDSVDPAPAARVIAREEIPTFAAALVDTSLPLFDRYKAMFSLRNAAERAPRAAVLALCEGFKDASPLFRHEVAYVLGQLAHAAAVPALKARTEDVNEHDMVRHEAAEALGAIGTGECVDFLGAFTGEDVPTMLRESCQVARDVVDYWTAGETKEQAS